MTVIENINIAYISQDLSLLSSADADGTKDLPTNQPTNNSQNT